MTGHYHNLICFVYFINFLCRPFLRSAFLSDGVFFSRLKNSTCRKRRFASLSVLYDPNSRPVVSESTTYFPFTFLIIRCRREDSNLRPGAYETPALTAELRRRSPAERRSAVLRPQSTKNIAYFYRELNGLEKCWILCYTSIRICARFENVAYNVFNR